MKITSREVQQAAGEGDFTINLTIEELQLMAALMSMVRMTGSDYATSALKLMDTIETVTDNPEFLYQSMDEVNLYVSVVDDGDTIIHQYHNSEITFEV